MSALATAVAIGSMMAPITSQSEGSLDEVTLRLDADRGTYSLGEPIRLTLEVRNNGDERAQGDFCLKWGADAGDLLYRLAGGRFAPVFNRRPADRAPDGTFIDAISGPTVLEPGEEQKMSGVFGLVPATGRYLLDQPGEYELKLVCRPRPWVFPALVVETNIVRFTIDAPPLAAKAAFADYQRDRLVLLAQAPLAAQQSDREVVRKAAEFLDRYPHTAYAEHVRKGLLELLRSRMRSSEATAAERQLYERLFSNEPVPD